MTKDNAFVRETEALREMRALEAIERNPRVSQRELAQSMGVALGIANACVHALVRKGLVKIRGENNRSISYHLTKTGLAHKSSLAMQWTMNTIGFYREARLRVAGALEHMHAEGVRRLLLYGASDLAEIALIAAKATDIEVVGVLTEAASPLDTLFAEVPVGGMELVAETTPDAIAVALIAPSAEVAEVKQRLAADTGLPVYGFFDETGEA